MGLFDKFFKSEPKEFDFKPSNRQEAWICILTSCASIDGELSEAETDSISKIVVYKTIFNGYDTIAYFKNALFVVGKIGCKATIDRSVSSIEPEDKNTLFTICSEVLLSDGKLDNDEKEILEYIAKSLEIPDEEAVKIIEVMLYRNKYNVIITS